MSIEIIKSGFISQVIDRVNLNLPGANAKTISASEKKYAAATFSVNGKDVRAKK